MHATTGAPPAPAIAALRAATAGRHAALESRLDMLGPQSLGRYIRILQAFDAFLSSWEPLLAASLPAGDRAPFAAGCRGGAATRDLDALGAPRLPSAPLDLPLDSPAAVLGSLYVLEGSALGAQVIGPALRRGLGLDADHGAGYFAGHGEDTGSRWRAFRARLEHELDTPAARDAACAAATATFDALAAICERTLQDEPAAC